jgi:hypothetical protein
MQARIYDKSTRIQLFETRFDESDMSKFTAFLEAHGFTPKRNGYEWENKERNHECAIFD